MLNMVKIFEFRIHKVLPFYCKKVKCLEEKKQTYLKREHNFSALFGVYPVVTLDKNVPSET